MSPQAKQTVVIKSENCSRITLIKLFIKWAGAHCCGVAGSALAQRRPHALLSHCIGDQSLSYLLINYWATGVTRSLHSRLHLYFIYSDAHPFAHQLYKFNSRPGNGMATLHKLTSLVGVTACLFGKQTSYGLLGIQLLLLLLLLWIKLDRGK